MMKKRFETKEIWLYRKMPTILWTEDLSSDEVLKKMKTKRRLILNIRKKELKFRKHIIKKEKNNFAQ